MASWHRLVLSCAGAVVVSGLQAEPSFYTARVAPVLDRHCVTCHGAEKHKAGLRLDSFEALMRGAESGAVIAAGDLKQSELYRRITLPDTDEEAMPGDGKPRLSADEVKILALWIEAGASPMKMVSDFPGAPALKPLAAPVVPLAPDWRTHSAEIATWERETGLRLRPRSLVPTDGLVLRTASAPSRATDAAIERLQSLAPYIVEAELARTRITDAGLRSITTWSNLRSLDLTRTAVTAAGVATLTKLEQLEALNLTATRIDAATAASLRASPRLKRLWTFATPAETAPPADKMAARDSAP